MFMMDTKKAREWLKDSDGYTVMLPEFFKDILPDKEIKSLTMDHGGGEGKFAITKDGEVLESCVGISEFMAINSLARLLNVEPCMEFFGRGKNFRETKGRCLQVLDEKYKNVVRTF